MDNTKLWGAVLGEIEVSMSEAVFKTWFKNTQISRIDGSRVYVLVGNIFVKNQLENKFQDKINQLIKKHSGNKASEVLFIIGDEDNKKPKKSKSTKTRVVGTQPTKEITSNNPNQLKDKYTFENYIVGPSNELAYTACLAAAENPSSKYNPLFIYGGVGLGKTHLIHAFGNKVLEKQPGAKVIYTSSESFINDFVSSIKNKKTFTDTYRQADVLIVDDIQFIGSAEKTQEEFFHTFNQLHQSNKQVILSCDTQPKLIPGLTERLQSRFEWGIAIDIQQPDYEMRCAILQSKADEGGVELPQETAEYLAANIQTNIRELEGSLNQLLAFCEIRNLEPNLETAKSLLANVRLRPKRISSKEVVKKVASHFSIDEADIKGPKRDKNIIIPRQIAMYLLRSELHLSFPLIAKELGRKDHTTAMHSVNKIEKSMYSDASIRDNLNQIKNLLYV